METLAYKCLIFEIAPEELHTTLTGSSEGSSGLYGGEIHGVIQQLIETACYLRQPRCRA